MNNIFEGTCNGPAYKCPTCLLSIYQRDSIFDKEDGCEYAIKLFEGLLESKIKGSIDNRYYYVDKRTVKFDHLPQKLLKKYPKLKNYIK